jgi:hypothetical protein
MKHSWFALPVLTAVAVTVVFVGCDSATSVVDDGPVDPFVSDFSLRDANSSSPTFNTVVSPRDFLGQVSAWYFGSAT